MGTQMSEAVTQDITILGTDGTLMRYYAVSGKDLSAQEIGWVLTVARAGHEPVIQALTVAEVIGDLRAMMPEDPSSLGVALAFTDGMIESLEQRVRELEGRGEDASELRNRATELRRERGDALADGESAA